MTKPGQRLTVLGLGVLLILGVCACTPASKTAPSPLNISRAHVIPEASEPATFVIVPTSQKQAEDPVFGVAANQVAAFLEQAGHIRVPAAKARSADWRVHVDVLLRIIDPTADGTPSRTYGYGWDGTGVQIVSTHRPEGQEAQPTYYKQLTVTVVAGTQTIYQGTAETTDAQADLVVGLPRLARALLDPFPGQGGSVTLASPR